MDRFLSLGALLLAAAALAVAALGGDAPQQALPAPTPGPSSQELRALRAQVDGLETRLTSLEDTVLRLSRSGGVAAPVAAAGPGSAPAAAPAALQQEVVQLRSEVQELMSGEALQSEERRAALKEVVSSLQQEMAEERRQLRQQQQANRRTLRRQRFFTEAGLSSGQQQDLTRLLEAEDAQRQALQEAAREGSRPRRDVRQEVRQLQARTDEEARRLLDEAQLARYLELRREERGGGQRGARRSGQQAPAQQP